MGNRHKSANVVYGRHGYQTNCRVDEKIEKKTRRSRTKEDLGPAETEEEEARGSCLISSSEAEEDEEEEDTLEMGLRLVSEREDSVVSEAAAAVAERLVEAVVAEVASSLRLNRVLEPVSAGV